MSTKLFVVLGATGLQGGSVARLFAQQPGWRVRALTRTPSKPSTTKTELRDLGIELMAADLDDPASLDAAFEGANVIFANTTFWEHLSDPTLFATAQATGKYPNQIAFDREIQQGRNAVDAAAKHVATLDRFIWSTLADTKALSNGDFVWNLHFDSKPTVTKYLKEAHPELAEKTSYFYSGAYLHNWRQNPALRPTKKADGSFTMTMPKVFEEYVAPFANPGRDTGIFVQALLNAPAGLSLLGPCARVSYGDFWRTWARIQGVELEIREGEFEFGGEMPEWLQWQFRDDFLFSAKFGYVGGDLEVKGPEKFGVDMGKVTDVEAWIRAEDWSMIL